MKSNKPIITCFAAAGILACMSTVSAQSESEHMRIYTHGGAVNDYVISEVDSIRYPVLTPAETVAISLADSGTFGDAVKSFAVPAIKNLMLSGPAEAADLAYIRQFLHTLSSLDLSNAAFAGDILPDHALFGPDDEGTGLYLLSGIVLPANLKEIGDRALSHAYMLKGLELPESLTSIGEEAFARCLSIDELTFPETLADIGPEAFSGCVSLRSAKILANQPPMLGENAFFGIAPGARLCVPLGSGRQYVQSEWSRYFKIFEDGYADNEIPEEAIDDNIMQFAIDGYSDPEIDNEHGFIIFKIPYGTPLFDMKETFSLRNGLSAYIDGKKLQSGESKHDYSRPVKITFADEMGYSREYVVMVRFTDMPIMYLETADNAEIADKQTYIDLSGAYLVSPEGNTSYTGAQARGYGRFSWNLDKHGYDILLPEAESILGLSEGTTYTLEAHYADKTLVRNKIVSEMAHEVFDSFSWTPSAEYLHLVLNGEYLGLYTISESIATGPSRVNIPNVADCKNYRDVDNYGFIIEFNSNADQVYNFSTTHAKFSGCDPDGSQLSSNYKTYISSTLRFLDIDLYSGEEADPESAKWYGNLFDIPSLVDWYIINELTKSNNAMLNFYCYMYYDPTDAKMHMGPLWDYDNTCGNINYGGGNCGSTEGFMYDDVAWIKRLVAIPDFRQRVKERFAEKKDALLELVNTGIAERTSKLGTDAEINFNRWPVFGIYVWPNPAGFEERRNFQSEIDYLTNWLSDRINWLDNAFKAY